MTSSLSPVSIRREHLLSQLEAIADPEITVLTNVVATLVLEQLNESANSSNNFFDEKEDCTFSFFIDDNAEKFFLERVSQSIFPHLQSALQDKNTFLEKGCTFFFMGGEEEKSMELSPFLFTKNNIAYTMNLPETNKEDRVATIQKSYSSGSSLLVVFKITDLLQPIFTEMEIPQEYVDLPRFFDIQLIIDSNCRSTSIPIFRADRFTYADYEIKKIGSQRFFIHEKGSFRYSIEDTIDEESPANPSISQKISSFIASHLNNFIDLHVKEPFPEKDLTSLLEEEKKSKQRYSLQKQLIPVMLFGNNVFPEKGLLLNLSEWEKLPKYYRMKLDFDLENSDIFKPVFTLMEKNQESPPLIAISRFTISEGKVSYVESPGFLEELD